jgi:type IV secretion system protein VirB10
MSTTVAPDLGPNSDLNPLTGEPGIPSVNDGRKASGAPRSVLMMLLVALMVIGGGGLALREIIGGHRAAADANAAPKDGGAAIAANPHLEVAPPKPTPGAPAAGAPEPAAPAPQASSIAAVIPAPLPSADDLRAIEVPRQTAFATAGATAADRAAAARSAAMSTPGFVAPSGADAATESPASGAASAHPLDGYIRNLQSVQDNLQHLQAGALAPSTTTSAAPPAPATEGIEATSTARIGAALLPNRSLTLPRGTQFTCALKTRIVSELAGPAGCQVLRNVYSEDGRVLLIERASHLDGVYRASVRPGEARIEFIWERLRTPNGVVVDLKSPATGPLGEVGLDGQVDEHWGKRLGAALLLSLLDDAVRIQIARQQSGASAIVLQGTGTNANDMAGKVLEGSVHIAPTITKNQGDVVGVVVARDVDFSTVYDLRLSSR